MLQGILQMEYMTEFMAQYGAALNFIGSIFGFAGTVFGAWRFLKERQAKKRLESSQQELDQALARLKHLESFAAGLKQYSAAV